MRTERRETRQAAYFLEISTYDFGNPDLNLGYQLWAIYSTVAEGEKGDQWEKSKGD